ncbi:hypothetical protein YASMINEVIRUS_533 [Yasminevirus sp. GU-2018]|uniref:Uncharacterized protein n=1 Tax=Yasminevirus sp. GU-2018 TaxID=2420051 RepID=A0A5K0U8C8_9VIRU|nr:hypothetical protein YASMINEVIRUS_533 [Yasminevirus sp. GU-2018]
MSSDTSSTGSASSTTVQSNQTNQPPQQSPQMTASRIVGNYLQGKTSEVSQCMQTYNNMLNTNNGAEFINLFVEPAYTQLKGKLCDPKSASMYVKHIIDHPDTIASINAKLDSIDARLESIESSMIASENKQEQESSWFDGKFCTLITIVIVCFLCLALSLYMKPAGGATPLNK